MNSRGWTVAGGLFGALGVGAGALGAHFLKGRLDAAELTTFEVAVRYQIFHALALVLIGLLAGAAPGRAVRLAVRLAGYAMLVGIVLFSGGIYGWLFTGAKPLVHFVPVGGVSFILGWLALAVAGWNFRS